MSKMKNALLTGDRLQDPNLPTTLHHISEIIPHILDRYHLSLDSLPPTSQPSTPHPSNHCSLTIACPETLLAI